MYKALNTRTINRNCILLKIFFFCKITQSLIQSQKTYCIRNKTILLMSIIISVLQNEREIREVHSWSLVSERLLYRDIQPGSIFQLRQGDVSLLCQVYKLPHFHLSEEIIDPLSNRFVLRLNSETSV